MINDHFILAAGSPDFSRQLSAIFRSEGWLVRSLSNEQAALRYLREGQEVPRYLVIDKLKNWAVRLARELQPQGTQIILSGSLDGSREELEGIIGVPFYSIMGLPWKVADVLLGKEFRDEDMARRLFPEAEIKMMEGSVFDKDLQRQLGLDSLVVFRRHGFNPMDVFTDEYLADPSPELEERTVIWSFGRHPNEFSVRRRLAEMLSEVADKGGCTVGISQIEFCDRNGEIMDDRRADEMLLRMVTRYMEGPGSLLPIRKIFILVDPRCKAGGVRRRVPPRPGERIPVRTGVCEQVYCRMLNRHFVERMGIDAIIDPIKRGFSESQGSWMGYIRDPARGVKLVSFMYDQSPERALTVKEYAKMMNGLIDALVYQGAKVIATFPLYLTDWLQRHPDKNVRLLYVDGYTPRD